MGTQNKNRHDKIYARCFKDLGKGFGLHRTILARDMQPGTCGYFNHAGAWVKLFQVVEFEEPAAEEAPEEEEGPLTQLTGAAIGSARAAVRDMTGAMSLLMRGPTAARAPPAAATAPVGTAAAVPPAAAVPSAAAVPTAAAAPALEALPLGSIPLVTIADRDEWGMKYVGQFRLTTGEGEVGASIPHAPIGGRLLAKLQNQTREGAVLLTDGKVTSHQADAPGEYAAWMDRSLPIILAGTQGIAIRKRGLWIIGHTFTAARRAVAVSQERGQTLMFGVDVNVPQIARAGASGKWWSEKVAKPGWEHYIAPGADEDPPAVDPKDHAVLFMSGIYWEPRFVGKGFKIQWEQKVKQVLAGGGPLQPVIEETTGEPDGSPVYICMTPYAVGDVDAPAEVPRKDYYDFEDAPTVVKDEEQ